MKKYILLFFWILGFVTIASAQTKKGTETVTIKTPTVQCGSCKNRIESNLGRVDGIQKIVVDPKKKTAKVTFINDRTNLEYIKTAIANLGYDADDISANKESYEKLPSCCKKPEDGGGMEKH